MGLHNGTTRGKRVYVKLKDGTKFIDKFHHSTAKDLHFDVQGKIAKSDIVTFSISRNGCQIRKDNEYN
jgi:hypothetical protein